MTIAPIHPSHDTEPTPIYTELAAVIDLYTRRPRLTVIPGGRIHKPRGARLAILNDGTGVMGAVLWNA